jgi:hypothetical protein
MISRVKPTPKFKQIREAFDKTLSSYKRKVDMRDMVDLIDFVEEMHIKLCITVACAMISSKTDGETVTITSPEDLSKLKNFDAEHIIKARDFLDHCEDDFVNNLKGVMGSFSDHLGLPNPYEEDHNRRLREAIIRELHSKTDG